MVTTSKNLLLNGKIYDCRPGETVLTALLRHHVDVPYACKKMTCMSCMMRSLNGTPPIKSQRELKETLQLQNNFLACGCVPHREMEIAMADEVLTRQVVAKVIALNFLSPRVLEVSLQCDSPIDFHGGQSILLLNYEHIGKKFFISSPGSARMSGKIVIHVERIEGGTFSVWMHSQLKVGDQLTVSGVSGELFYTPGELQQPLLLVAWNGGLGALIGVIQDVFEEEHSGPVHLFHGVSNADYLYLIDELKEISEYFPNFTFIPCVDHHNVPADCLQGSVDQVIETMVGDLSDWKVFLCGGREQVHKVQKNAYLAGAKMKDIYLEVTSI
ncbi:MAG: 2Fe-2S iron-sulfur cluster binding domain-containing protein [Methylococcales bacterium]|nr:2Fe-2S iron-sulfur cluster binding domain-containing protein [Methylococcales bacterium]